MRATFGFNVLEKDEMLTESKYVGANTLNNKIWFNRFILAKCCPNRHSELIIQWQSFELSHHCCCVFYSFETVIDDMQNSCDLLLIQKLNNLLNANVNGS